MDVGMLKRGAIGWGALGNGKRGRSVGVGVGVRFVTHPTGLGVDWEY